MSILKNLSKYVRKEEIEIGKFSKTDILRILYYRATCLFRGFIYLNLRNFKSNLFFIGRNVRIIGKEKIEFSTGLTLGNNVTISAIGSKYFKFGNNFSLKDYSLITSFTSIKKESGILDIGNNVGISEFAYISLRGDLVIGNDVIIGPGLKIFTENHSFESKNLPYRLQDEIREKVIIGNNVWIGSSVIILAGAIIEDNCVIAAGAVVKKGVYKNSILIGGVPAKFIKNINKI